MMRKFLYVFLMIIIFSLVITGCGTKNEEEEGTEITGTPLELNQLPPVLMQRMDDLKQEEGYYAFKTDGFNYLVACWGQKNTGGYSVSFEKIIRRGNVLEAIVAFEAPDEGDVVTEALTYPFAVIKIPPLDKGEVVFKDTDGETLATVQVEGLSPLEESGLEKTVSLYYGTEEGNLRQEPRTVPAGFTDLSPEEKAEILIDELKKGSQALEIDRFSDGTALLEKVKVTDISYDDKKAILTVKLDEEFLDIPADDREIVSQAVIMTLTSILEPATFKLEIIDDTGEVAEEYSKTFK